MECVGLLLQGGLACTQIRRKNGTESVEGEGGGERGREGEACSLKQQARPAERLWGEQAGAPAAVWGRDDGEGG